MRSHARRVLDLGPFEPHPDAQIVGVDGLPLSRVPQHPGEGFDKLGDSFRRLAFADGLGTPRAE